MKMWCFPYRASKKRTVIIKTNLLERETRINKEIKTLTDNGYLVTFLGWDRGFKTSMSERRKAGDFYKEIRLRLKAPWGIKILLFLPIWWCFVFFWLTVTRWDIAHAGEFASIPPTVVAGKLKRKPVIYEILDVYEDEIALPKVIRNICIKIDRVFMRLANSVVLADEAQIEEVGGFPNSKIVTIYDSPPDTFGRANISHRRNGKFTLFFAGLLSSTRALNLDKVFTAIKGIEGVKVIIAGYSDYSDYGDLVEKIKELVREMPDKIQFIGEITHAEVLERSARADLLFVLRDPIVPVNKYICGSKVLEAMMCGTPILVNKGTSTANKVREEKCGLVVDANNIEEIKEAIIRLRDNPELCEELGANGRKAYEKRYSWEIMERRLLALYHELTGEVGK
jgi:glycosyltransferase involved in cell wall biosynthesis